jgi:hypothetical protein
MTYQMFHKRVFDPNLAKEIVCVSIIGQAVLGRNSGEWWLHEVKTREPGTYIRAYLYVTWGRRGFG